jgi:hypothetical protein
MKIVLKRHKTTKWFALAFFLLTVTGMIPHIVTRMALLDSYIYMSEGDYFKAREAIQRAHKLEAYSVLNDAQLQRAIVEQYALAHAKEYPESGVYPALLISMLSDNGHLLGSREMPSFLVFGARHSNLRGEIGAAQQIYEKFSKHVGRLTKTEKSELIAEVAYDELVEVLYVIGRKINDQSITQVDELLAPARRKHAEGQIDLCKEIPYRCEINNIRWRVAECNLQKIISDSVGIKCIEETRKSVMDLIGDSNRGKQELKKCTEKFGLKGCAAIADELSRYRETLPMSSGINQ